MSENKFDGYLGRPNSSAESKIIAMSEAKPPLIFVQIPKNKIPSKEKLDVKSRANSTPGGITHFRPLGAKVNPFSHSVANKKESMPPCFTISKTNLPASTNVTITKKKNINMAASKPLIGKNVSMSQMMEDLLLMRANTNSTGKSFVRSATMPNISVAIVSTSSGTVMSQSIQTSTGTSLTLVNSGSTLKLSTGILRSPTVGHKYSPTLQLSPASSKPIILHSKMLSAPKNSQCRPSVISSKKVLSSKQGMSLSRPQDLLLSNSSLQSVSSPTESLLKNQIHLKMESGSSSSWTPPPLILQGGGNLKHINKKGPSSISIVTGKGNNGKNTISVIPLARKGLRKCNMVNLKIANGQIVRDSSEFKVDGMAPACDARSISLTRPASSQNSSPGSIYKEERRSTKDKDDSTFFRRVTDGTSKPKDILEEAMCAMASDIDEMSFIDPEANEEYCPFSQASPSSLECQAVTTFVSVEGNIPDFASLQELPILGSAPGLVQSSSRSATKVISSEASKCVLPLKAVLPLKVPISTPLSAPVPMVSSELPGLIIRTDSVTVRRKLSKEDDKKDPIKPDLSIIPILRNSSLEKSPLKKSSRVSMLNVETFSGGKSTLEILKSSLANSSPIRKEDNFAEEINSSECTSDAITDDSPDVSASETVDEQDFRKLLKWQNGMGSLDGCDLKFRINEFDAVELVEDGAVDKIRKKVDDEASSKQIECIPHQNQAAQVIHVHHARKPNHHKDVKKDDELADSVSDLDQMSKVTKDFYQICCCKNCGCYGLSSEFLKEKGNSFCTVACSEDYEVKEIEWNKEKLRLEKNKTRSKKVKTEEAEYAEKLESKENENLEQEGMQPCLSLNKEIKEHSTNSDPVKSQPVWKDTKQSFSWVKYLEQCGKNKGLSKAAPLKLWNEPFPFGRNLFKSGMKVEGIDPQHQSLFCVMTVVDIIGHRIRLHIDGYSSVHDFWCNDSSPNIFQVGWCEKNGRILETPPGTANFTWKAYLEHCKVAPAPRQAFSTRNCTTVTTPSNFRIGMKLEAEDRKNGWTCVATVADILDNRILVHFDGWDKAFDTWFDVNSPFIHPVGWCSDSGVFLFPPKDYSDPDNFSWHEYIQETNSVAVPARAFKTRSPKNFKKDMKIEAVDKRNPMLVRVATIVETKIFKLKIHFDGWPEEYDYWVDDDSPDIHPPTWCSKTGHPLQSPLDLNDIDSNGVPSSGCGTPGCKGYGHIKGLIYCTHHTSYGCPYSLQNLDKDWESLLPDRLESYSLQKKSKSSKQIINLDISKPIPFDQEDEDQQKKRVRKRRKFFDELSPPECSKIKIPRLSSDELRIPNTYTKPLNSSCPYNTRNSVPSTNISIAKPSLSEEGRIDSIVHRSIFNPFYHPKPPVPRTLTLETHKKFVTGKDVKKLESEKWTSKEVRNFISEITDSSFVAKKFTDHKIDGKSLLMMTQQDLIDILDIKLGPAIKIMASIISVRHTL